MQNFVKNRSFVQFIYKRKLNHYIVPAFSPHLDTLHVSAFSLCHQILDELLVIPLPFATVGLLSVSAFGQSRSSVHVGFLVTAVFWLTLYPSGLMCLLTFWLSAFCLCQPLFKSVFCPCRPFIPIGYSSLSAFCLYQPFGLRPLVRIPYMGLIKPGYLSFNLSTDTWV